MSGNSNISINNNDQMNNNEEQLNNYSDNLMSKISRINRIFSIKANTKTNLTWK